MSATVDIEARRAYHREYYRANRERIRERANKRQAANHKKRVTVPVGSLTPAEIEARRARDRAYYWANHERILERARKWRTANPVKRRWQQRWQKYGVTPEQGSAMLVAQDGLCAVCYEVPAVYIDHDHKTGVFRGMLCNACNVGLGQFADRPDLLRAAALYLEGQ